MICPRCGLGIGVGAQGTILPMCQCQITHSNYKNVPPLKSCREVELEEQVRVLREALIEVLAAERYSNRPPETVMEAEKKLDRIRNAVKKSDDAIAATAPKENRNDTK